MIHKITANVR